MLTTKDLITKGFFPEELIPSFSTVKMANCLDRLNLGRLFRYARKQKKSRLCAFTIPRLRNLRRTLGLPNPLHQIVLSDCISSNWDDINAHFSKSVISISRPTIKKDSKRAIDYEYEHKQKEIQNLLRSIGARFNLRIDISRYYPTIYTHSIPWALHTKLIAKSRQRDDSLLGNKIDTSVRNTQDSQALGIPIGPDTSLILSEIIGTALDEEIQKRYNVRGYRHIDDFSLFFSSSSEAENALSDINSILKGYELEINPQKTEIVALPEEFIPEWKTEIKCFRFRTTLAGQKNDILDYFSKSFKYSNSFPNDSVLKYALKKISSELIKENNWSIFESLVLKSIVADPKCMETAAEILLRYSNNLHYDVSKTRISETINEMLSYHSKFRHDYELSWSLYIAKSLELKIPQILLDSLSKIESPIVILTILDLRNRSLIEGNIETSKWESYIKRDELYTENWLLAYEALIKGWLNSSDGFYVNNDEFFKILNDNAVEFYIA